VTCHIRVKQLDTSISTRFLSSLPPARVHVDCTLTDIFCLISLVLDLIYIKM